MYTLWGASHGSPPHGHAPVRRVCSTDFPVYDAAAADRHWERVCALFDAEPVIQHVEDHVVFPDGLVCPGGLVEQSIDYQAVLQCLPLSGALDVRTNWETTLTNTADGTSVWVHGGYTEMLTGIEYENDTCPQDLWSAVPLATDYTRSGALVRASIPGLGLAWSDIGHFSIDLVTYESFSAGNFTDFDLCEYFELTECTETTPYVPGCDGGCYPDWWMGDGWCDEPLNCAERDYDGGDCL